MERYIGNKDFSNVIHFIVNRLPKSNRYFSLFFGSGGLEKSVYTAGAFFICAEKNPRCKNFENPDKAVIKYDDYKSLIEDNVFTQEDFVFADPPYMFSTRRAAKKYYKFEFDYTQHVEFLNHISSIDTKIMITHPENELYNERLKGWFREDLKYMTQGGWYVDSVYMNYNPKEFELLNYDCLGVDFTDRQRIKRQRQNIVNKFKKLDPQVRNAICKELHVQQLIKL